MAAGHDFEEPFVYGTLDSENKQIRIVRLEPEITPQDVPHCRLLTVSLKKIFRYRALSYTWGDPIDQHPIVVDDRTLWVTRNLLHFLRQAACELRDSKSDENTYWIDAICINQEDKAEKNSQVAMMGEIYTRATDMEIWLGPAYPDSLHAIDFLGKLASAQTSVDPKRSGLLQARVGFSVIRRLVDICEREQTTVVPLVNLANRSWWSRIWIQQEVTLAKSSRSRLKCGEHLIPWRKVVLAHDVLHSLLKYTQETQWHLTGDTHPENISSVLSGLTRAFARMQQTCTNSYPEVLGDDKARKQSLANRLVANAENFDHRLQAGDPRDYVYGLLAISKDSGLQPDYSKEKEALYPEVSRYLLGTVGAYTFSMCARETSSSTSLPSWVPDLSITTCRRSLLQTPRTKGSLDKVFDAVFRSSFPYQVCGNRLQLQAKRVGEVAGGRKFRTVSPQQENVGGSVENMLREWLLSYDRFLHDGRPGHSLSETRPDLADVWWRIPICDRAPIMIRGLWHKSEKRCFDELMAQAKAPSANLEIGRETSQYRDRMLSLTLNRSPFMTDTGRPGLGPGDVEADDEVFVVIGGEAPLVFRPVGDGTYRLVGEAYVHGLNGAKELKQESQAEIIIVV